MSEEQSDAAAPGPTALSAEDMKQINGFFKKRLIGQPEVVAALTNVLYKQNALFKRLLEHDQEAVHQVGVPADPTVLLLMGGSWGKSLATRLIPMALSRFGRGSITILTPLSQDPEGTLNMDPRVVAAPFATVIIENVETTPRINARFVSNLAHLLDTGMMALVDPAKQAVRPIPLGLATFIMTTGVADTEIRETLNPETRLGFLHPADDKPASAEAMYERVRLICNRALELLPPELLRHVDETIVLRPLGEDDLREVFDLEIAHYEQSAFPGRALSVGFEGDARARLFAEARDGLRFYGAHALRRELQRRIDPVVYRAYNDGTLTEANFDEHKVIVRTMGDGLDVQLT